MADYPVTYEIVGNQPGQILVRYKMGSAQVDMWLQWTGVGDIDEFIGKYIPRVALEAQQSPPIDTSSLVGKTGVPKEPAATPAPGAPETPPA